MSPALFASTVLVLGSLPALVGPAHATETACVVSTVPGDTTCVTFGSTGAVQSWTVPAGVTSANFTLVGADGGGTYSAPEDGGLGARIEATMPVTAADVLRVIVGKAGTSTTSTSDDVQPGGFNGGGAGKEGGAGGGGATDVRSDGDLASRLLVAAGGGGAMTSAAPSSV